VVQKKLKLEKTELGENNMHISNKGLELIKHFEGCPVNGAGDPVAYLCPAGVWTIGYGHIKNVKEHDRWTMSHAEYILREELEDEYEGYINDLVKVPLEQCMFDALVAWVFNLGPTNLSSSSLLRVLNEKKYEEVPEQIKRWNKANGQVLAGLVKRREAEALMFEGKEWSKV
jgi:lysozyme